MLLYSKKLERILPDTFHKVCIITLISKLDKDMKGGEGQREKRGRREGGKEEKKGREIQANILDECRHKNPQLNTDRLYSTAHYDITHHS